MALSPYINPTNLNGALQSSYLFRGSRLYESDKGDALDKNNENVFGTVTEYIDAVKDISDSIENAFGVRAPMYKIGDIGSTLDEAEGSQYVPNSIKGLVRAVIDWKGAATQEGVIIDGIGNVDGRFAVEFTTNPILFRSSQIVDNRYRQPSELKMTIFVSNYLNDDITGTLTDSIAGLDPTGLTTDAKNALSYGGNTRAQYALYKLRWLMENCQPFNVYTPHGVYENMVIKSISPQTNQNTMDMLYCDVEFRELILYAPYTDDFGKMPARMSTKVGIREGWTQIAEKKTDEMLTGA